MSRAHALSACLALRLCDNKEARMIRTARHYLLQWLAAIGWPGALAAMMRNHAYREAVQLSRTSTTSTQPPPNLYSHTNACISTLRELYTDVLSLRDFLRSCLNNAPPRIQQRWRVQPNAILRRYSPIRYTLTHMGTGEVTFKDMGDGNATSKAGFDKIRFCGEQARCDGLQYFWVDTCCIDKSSSAELQEAITSMFHWYRNAAK